MAPLGHLAELLCPWAAWALAMALGTALLVAGLRWRAAWYQEPRRWSRRTDAPGCNYVSVGSKFGSFVDTTAKLLPLHRAGVWRGEGHMVRDRALLPAVLPEMRLAHRDAQFVAAGGMILQSKSGVESIMCDNYDGAGSKFDAASSTPTFGVFVRSPAEARAFARTRIARSHTSWEQRMESPLRKYSLRLQSGPTASRRRFPTRKCESHKKWVLSDHPALCHYVASGLALFCIVSGEGMAN